MDLLSGADKYYLFHNVRTRDALRPRTEGPFGTWVKKLFGKYAGVEVVPKNLGCCWAAENGSEWREALRQTRLRKTRKM